MHPILAIGLVAVVAGVFCDAIADSPKKPGRPKGTTKVVEEKKPEEKKPDEKKPDEKVPD